MWNFILYLLYGLAFFTLGVAILSRDLRSSELGIARIIGLLALFGIFHGFHEWFELLEQIYPQVKTATFMAFRLVLVALSFIFLLYFGLFINIITLLGEKALQTTAKPVKLSVAVCVALVAMGAGTADYLRQGDALTRLLVAFPGGLLSGLGLILYSRTVRAFSRKVSVHFILAGLCMICYAFFTGIFTSEVVVPLLDVKIILLRGISAFLLTFFTIRGLYVFNLEQHELTRDKLRRFAQSEKLASLGVLAAGIAHEINNPLTNISLSIEMLEDRLAADAGAMRRLESIRRNCSRASKIAGELLHFSRDSGSEPEIVDLNLTVRGAFNLLGNQRRATVITLHEGAIPPVRGISWKLEEVVINLLLNSLDACTADDHIEVDTALLDGWVVLTVSDTGHGIDEKVLYNVFDPFFTTKEVGRGTGLGLSVSYNIIKQHGGEISIRSSINGGTVVTVKLPPGEDGQ